MVYRIYLLKMVIFHGELLNNQMVYLVGGIPIPL
jgi:hypothetical protein